MKILRHKDITKIVVSNVSFQNKNVTNRIHLLVGSKAKKMKQVFFDHYVPDYGRVKNLFNHEPLTESPRHKH